MRCGQPIGWRRPTIQTSPCGILACVDNGLWNQSQRIRQYTGGHDETWGGATLAIDSNVLAGPVADLRPPLPPPTPTLTVTVDIPLLAPPYADDMCGSAWHRYTDDRGQLAYLTANRPISGPVPIITNSARWQPALTASGWYTVEAYIPAHGVTAWERPDAPHPCRHGSSAVHHPPRRRADAANWRPGSHQQHLAGPRRLFFCGREWRLCGTYGRNQRGSLRQHDLVQRHALQP